MRNAYRKALLLATSFFALSPVLMAGCSDDDDDGNAGRRDSGAFCPADLPTALDPKTACVGEGFECPLPYNCGAIDQQAYCVCTKGKFVCQSGRGEPIDNAASPPCTPQGSGSDKECPGSQNGTDGTACKTPGLQCFYEGFVCPESNGVPKIDVCQCKAGSLPDGGPTLQFNCEIKYCNPKSDASIPIPPPPDAGQG
jgi:hypothetical protein